MEWLVTILVFIGVLLMTAVLFVGWLVMLGVRAVTYVVREALGRPAARGRTGLRSVVCPRERCRAANPPQAHFCRRCGRMLAADRQVVSRAAIW